MVGNIFQAGKSKKNLTHIKLTMSDVTFANDLLSELTEKQLAVNPKTKQAKDEIYQSFSCWAQSLNDQTISTDLLLENTKEFTQNLEKIQELDKSYRDQLMKAMVNAGKKFQDKFNNEGGGSDKKRRRLNPIPREEIEFPWDVTSTLTILDLGQPNPHNPAYPNGFKSKYRRWNSTFITSIWVDNNGRTLVSIKDMGEDGKTPLITQSNEAWDSDKHANLGFDERKKNGIFRNGAELVEYYRQKYGRCKSNISFMYWSGLNNELVKRVTPSIFEPPSKNANDEERTISKHVSDDERTSSESDDERTESSEAEDEDVELLGIPLS